MIKTPAQLSSLLTSMVMVLCACSSTPEPAANRASDKTNELSIPYVAYQLDNGLNVILHQDRSDPIVAISTTVHVGSSREKPGRTGFAHFFEHMAFNDSENVPQGANRKMIAELGGERNGGTWTDGTIYYEVVPKDAFEKLLWIDSDRLGYMIKTVNETTLEREKQVVKNEKRQRVDNRPYGHTGHVIRKALYPTDHPYNWTVIGDLEDLQAATLADVREFYDEYYVPNNVTVVIAGDIDIEPTKALVEQWFGEIKPGPVVEDLPPRPVTLTQEKRLYHLDNFARLPELRITLPTVEEYHPDSYALSALGEILAFGKRAPLRKLIVDELKLAPRVFAFQSSSELAGTFTISVRGNRGVKLDDVHDAIYQALQRFETDGFSDNDLQRIKARQETSFYAGVSSVLNKAFQLGNYAEYAGDPGYVSQDIERIKAVTRDDIVRVYRRYVKDKPAVITSFVPKNEEALILSGSDRAAVVEEQIVQGAEADAEGYGEVSYEKTPTRHDRSEPPLGPTPVVSIPNIWETPLDSGLRVLGIEHNEQPLVEFFLTIPGGQWLDPTEKIGAARLLAELMNEGTATRTPAELEDAIGLLGARLNVSASRNELTISGRTLARNFNATTALLTEMLLMPRWDEDEFERLKQERLTSIEQSLSNPQQVANNAFARTLYGTAHPAGLPLGGTRETVKQLTLQDLKDWYANNLSLNQATLHVVGDVTQSQVIEAMRSLQMPSRPAIDLSETGIVDANPGIYFIDIPDAKQSVIVAGKPALTGSNRDYYPLTVAQNRLGAGSSARLFQTLRIGKGYTYGAYSSVRQTPYTGAFVASSQVRSNVTLESLDIFRELIGQYTETYGDDDLATTKNLLIKGETRRYETFGGMLGMLGAISEFGLPLDYVKRRQQTLKGLTLADVHALQRKYLDEAQLTYVIAGDAATQLQRVKEFASGEVTLLDRHGNPI